MKDPDAVQRLLRLKRYESPGEDFFAEFAESLKEQQRSELLRRSSMGLFAERLKLWCAESYEPRWMIPAAAAAALLLVALPATRLATGASPPSVEPTSETALAEFGRDADGAALDLSAPPAEEIELTFPSPAAPGLDPAPPLVGGAAGVLPASVGYGLREL